MIMIKRYVYILFFLISPFALLMFGIYPYFSLERLGAFSNAEVKFTVENIFYVSLILTTVILIFAGTIYMRSRKLYRELDRAHDMLINGQSDLSDFFARLGGFGKKLNLIIDRLEKLNKMKSVKISTLSEISKFLLENIELKIIVFDVFDTVLNCSKSFLFKYEIEKSAIMNKNIRNFFGELNFQDVIFGLEKTRDIVSIEDVKAEALIKYKGDLLFYPIFNSSNTLAAIICILNDVKAAEKLSQKTEQINISETSTFKEKMMDILRGHIIKR